ncbi:MAG: restriction endonuclease [Deltaproteobacteria bacterium]|nr:restriction endonuclease [Deltaproteobacteria bacterium]
MAIPDFQAIMLPLLKHFGDGQEHSNRETCDMLAGHFHLTEEELSELVPSGGQPLFYNRVAWARSDLKRAGCIQPVKRGVYRITDRGRSLLARGLSALTMRVLQELGDGAKTPPVAPPPDLLTPEEQLDAAYKTIRQHVAADLLERIKTCPPSFFERLVVQLLLALGYGGSQDDAGKAVGKSGDGGIDGIIKEDRLGLDLIYLQAKRWDATVGRPEIQKFVGALQGQKARKGVFITTSDFSKEARGYASQVGTAIVLIDGETLAELMIDCGLGVTRTTKYEIPRVDSDYFEEG